MSRRACHIKRTTVVLSWLPVSTGTRSVKKKLNVNRKLLRKWTGTRGVPETLNAEYIVKRKCNSKKDFIKV